MEYHSGSNKRRPPLGSIERFRAAVGMLTRGNKTASAKGTAAFASAKRKKELGKGKIAKVMHEFGGGELHSGSDRGPIVKDRKQAIAIALSEQRRANRA